MRITTRERHRRMAAGLEEAMKMAGDIPADPGLRDVFPALPRAPIRLLVGPLNKDINQGGLLRLAEAFRLERVDYSPEWDGAMDFAGSRGTKLHQPWGWAPLDEACDNAEADGYHLVAVTLSDRAVPFDHYEWPFPLALVLGAELQGVPDEIEARCEASVAIPIYGMVQSLNVVCAAGIVLQSAFSAFAQTTPDFTPARNASRRLMNLPEIDYRSMAPAPTDPIT